MSDILLSAFTDSVIDMAVRASGSNAPVLICGETGCGKTALAKVIHECGRRGSKPFLRADCGSIPETLFEREMFGHVRGAFTDAKDSQPGLFEVADGGTLFLDEVGDFPTSVQAKLLSVLDDGVIRRVGSPRSRCVDVRIISASNRDLPELINAREFRADLYYRLGVVTK